jgi:hypothetical protein
MTFKKEIKFLYLFLGVCVDASQEVWLMSTLTSYIGSFIKKMSHFCSLALFWERDNLLERT